MKAVMIMKVVNQDNRNEATEQHILKTRCANQTVSPLALLKNPSYRDKDTANSLFNTPTTKALSLDKKLASEKLSTEDTPIYDSLAFLESRLCPKSSSKRYHRKRGKISGETQKKRISSPDFRNCKHIGTFFSAICKKESILQKVEAKLQQYEAKKLKIENDLKYMKTKFKEFKEFKYSQRLSDYDNSHYPDMIPSESRVQDIGAADSGIEIDTENLLASLNSSYLPPTFQALGDSDEVKDTNTALDDYLNMIPSIDYSSSSNESNIDAQDGDSFGEVLAHTVLIHLLRCVQFLLESHSKNRSHSNK